VFISGESSGRLENAERFRALRLSPHA